MPGSFRLGKLVGITVSVHLSWFIILVLLTWSLARDWFPQFFAGWSTGTYWLAAFISTLLLFLGVLAHEMAHAQVARSHRLTVKGITLFVFGGVADIAEEVKRPGAEFQIAFLLALPFRESSAPTEAILEYLAVSNLLVGVFNLIPGFPLDGGRILRSIIWKRTGNFQKATRMTPRRMMLERGAHSNWAKNAWALENGRESGYD